MADDTVMPTPAPDLAVNAAPDRWGSHWSGCGVRSGFDCTCNAKPVPAPDLAAVEAVAEALYHADLFPVTTDSVGRKADWGLMPESTRDEYRHMAKAALRAVEPALRAAEGENARLTEALRVSSIEAMAAWMEIVRLTEVLAGAEASWRCFHCGEVFTNANDAREHFGRSEMALTGCEIKGHEHSLLGKIREQEDQLHSYRNEDSATLRAMAALQGEHAAALRREEEAGYARGLQAATATAREEADHWLKTLTNHLCPHCKAGKPPIPPPPGWNFFYAHSDPSVGGCGQVGCGADGVWRERDARALAALGTGEAGRQ